MSDSHTHHVPSSIHTPSSQHKFPTNKVTNLMWSTLYCVICFKVFLLYLRVIIYFTLSLSSILISFHLCYSYEHPKGELWVNDSHTHHVPSSIHTPSSRHKFPTIKVTNFMWNTLYCVICYFLPSVVISFWCCLLTFPVLPLSFTLLPFVLLSTSIKIASHLPCVLLTPYTGVVTVVGHTVSLHNR